MVAHLLPSGLYRRLRLHTGSAPGYRTRFLAETWFLSHALAGSAREGHTAGRELGGAVAPLTLPRRCLFDCDV